MLTPVIDLAAEQDIPTLLAFANWAAAHTSANFATEPEPESMWRESFRATRSTHPWLVARNEGRVLGFAKGSPHRARGAYRFTAEVTVYIDAELLGRGIGRALYRVLLPMLRAQGYVTLLAGITPGNPASEKLHAAFGFQRCGTYRRVGWKDGRWHDVGYFERHLQDDHLPPSELRTTQQVWPKVTAGLAGQVVIERAAVDSATVRALIDGLNAELSAVYPEPGATHFRLEEEEVKAHSGVFLLASLDGEAVGCGAMRLLAGGEAELKRMYVLPRFRGLCICTAVLSALQERARALGARRVVLETGVRQAAALRIYERAGYVRIPAFGEYVGSPLSVCMAKEL
jgi:L-amino acid N-acyltransferase YncA